MTRWLSALLLIASFGLGPEQAVPAPQARLQAAAGCQGQVPAHRSRGSIVFEFRQEGKGDSYGPSHLYAVTPDGRSLNRLAGNGADPVISPDGRRVAFEQLRGTFKLPKLVALDIRSGRRTILARSGTEMTWSPCGDRLAFTNLGIRTVSRTGGKVTKLTDKVSDKKPSWSPDGGAIAFIRVDPDTVLPALARMNADGSNQRVLWPVDRYSDHVRPAWSPDGASLAFAGEDADRKSSYLYVISSDGTAPHKLVTRSMFVFDIEWSPSGAQILFVAASTNGPDYGAYVVRPDGRGLRRITSLDSNSTSDQWARWSRDGRKIVLVKGGDLRVVGAGGGPLRRVTRVARSFGACLAPTWLPRERVRASRVPLSVLRRAR